MRVQDVVALAIEAKKRFPYMVFRGVKFTDSKARYASIDRIDSSKDYSDITNIQILPLWLNMAKADLSENELKVYMQHYLNLC